MSAVIGNLRPDSARHEFAPMQTADLDAVLAAERRIYAFPWSRGNFADSLASGYSAWLMHRGANMLGYAVMMLVLDEAHLLNISIVPEQQRNGLGSLLLEYLLSVAAGQGAARMFLEVRPSNAAGRAFYAHHRFVQVGERPAYYPAQAGREAALVLERVL